MAVGSGVDHLGVPGTEFRRPSLTALDSLCPPSHNQNGRRRSSGDLGPHREGSPARLSSRRNSDRLCEKPLKRSDTMTVDVQYGNILILGLLVFGFIAGLVLLMSHMFKRMA